MGVAAVQARQSDHVQQFEHPGAAIGPPPYTEGHVAADREVREERPFLGHVADATMLARDEDAAAVVDHLGAQHDFAAVEPLETRDDAQQRRLAAPRRAQDPREAARRNGEVHPVEDAQLAERFAGAPDGELSHLAIVADGSGRTAPAATGVPAAAAREGSRSNHRPST